MRIAATLSGLVLTAAAAAAGALYAGLAPADWRADLVGAIERVAGFILPAPAPPAPPKAAAPVPVQIARVRSEEVPITLSGIGSVRAYNLVNVKTRVDGEITEILFREGQEVKAGELLAIVDPRPLQAQLEAQEAMRSRNQALLDAALLDFRRYESLVQRDFSSRQQYDQQRALVDQYRAQLRTDAAQISYARTQLGYTSIRAPIAGRVGIRQVDQGNVVRASEGASIVVITQLQPISAIFTLSAQAVAQARLNLGQAQVPVVALAADNRTELDRGMVELIDNQVDPATGTIKLKASFPNEKQRLWPGDFVNGRLTVDQKKGLTVPASALRHGPRGDFVWVLRPDGTVEWKTVTAGQRTGDRILVERGLTGTEQVVTEGHYRLENGTKVEVVQPTPATPAPNPAPAAPRPAGKT
jgi:multidrug efflux system membrane fusion protein